MSQAFIHLQVHSEYSIVDGIVRINDYVERGVALKMPALALTDCYNLFALVKFYRRAIAAGIKPIIGAEVLVACDDAISHCTILCKNQQGYQHLTELLSKAYQEGYRDHKPVIDWAWLQQSSAGLIVLSGAEQGDVGRALLQGNRCLAEQHLQRWQQSFEQHYYLELRRLGRDRDQQQVMMTLELAREYQVPVVATNAVRFLHANDFEAHEARVCIQQGRVLDDAQRPRDYTEKQYLKSVSEMQALFSDIPEALQNSVEIAKRCNLSLALSSVFLPQFPTPNHEKEDDYLRQQSMQGLQARLQKTHINEVAAQKSYQQRLDRELDVIINMGFSGYFLIVADFIAWAKENHVPVGPGRGSGAGSLVAYALGITELDPLLHDLLFERFLNPERISMPDFDIDFCMAGRDRVIDYVGRRYGQEKVAQIITYGTMAAKAVVRDVGRVLGLPYGFVDKVAKLVPFELGMTLSKALAQEEVLQQRYEQEDEVRSLIDLAMKLEGITRNAGKHAGGVVIAPTQLTDFLPLYCEEKEEQALTQFDKDDVEAIGLVKFDFLGLRTLTIIEWALQTINTRREKEQLEAIDIAAIALDDVKTFELLKRCATTAVFQLESRGMKELIRRLQPDSFDDITALVALFRPGPLQSGMVDDFIDRKHGRAKVNYPHPELAAVLKSTYGVILYQEQVMQIAQVLAGYTLGGADILRRAMGKKKPEEMAKQRSVFVDGAKNRGIDVKVAEYVFDLVEKFAGYGFNKSHSAAYALIAYQTAWLKTHYPAEFMAAVLSSDMDNTDKVVGFIQECRLMKLTVRPPHINEGCYSFTVNAQGEIVYGLGAIKGVGESLIQDVVSCREKGGDFVDLFSFCLRIDTGKLTRRALEPFIRSGAMDIWQKPREVLLANVDNALQYANQQRRNLQHGQGDLFAGDDVEAVVVQDNDYLSAQPWSDLQRLQAEKASTGLYLTGHPLDAHADELQAMTKTRVSGLADALNTVVVLAGIIVNLRVITTRTGKRMALLTVEDTTGRVEVTLFNEVYQDVALKLEGSTIFLFKGEVAKDDYTGGVKLVVDAVLPFEEARERLLRGLTIQVDNEKMADTLIRGLPDLIRDNGVGRCPVNIDYRNNPVKAQLQLGDQWRIKPSTEFLSRLYELCGRDKVQLHFS